MRSLVPPARLLEYDVRDGWGPLCRFLDVPVPMGKGHGREGESVAPFPRSNTLDELRVSFEKKREAQLRRRVRRAGLMLVLLVGLTGVVWKKPVSGRWF